jgi:[acyl-carrier-protein] S-malonyltransferase
MISGGAAALQRAAALARERGARLVRRLPISTPGHSPLMRDAADQMSRFMKKVAFRNPDPPLVSNISARVLKSAEEVRDELSDQMCSAVEWARCVTVMADSGVDTFVELGPGNALSKMVRHLSKDVETVSTEEAPTEALLSLTEELPAALPAGASRSGLAEAV